MDANEHDYLLDIPGLEPPDDAPPESSAGDEASPGRRWIGVRFDCCGTYQRIYKNREGSAYEGRCPRCARALRVKVGPSGTDARFFVAE